MLLKITSVDMHGYNGREYHPDETDEGLVVLVVGAEAMYTDGEGATHPMTDSGTAVNWRAARAAAVQINDPESATVLTMWTTMTEDGRLLNLLDHEVESFRDGGRL